MRCANCLTALLLFAVAAGCEKPAAGRPEPPPAPVIVTTATKKTMPVQVRAIGSVKTIATVAIRPRVSGELTEVGFKEGEFVEKNKILFTIDPRPFDAAVKQAEANLAKSLTVRKGAELEMQRAEEARRSGVGASTDYDAALTALASAKAAVEADRVAITTAKIQAGFTTIRSPIDGRVGELLVTKGNLVDASGTNPLVVINQISPIYVAFSLPEQNLPAVIEARKRGPVRVSADLQTGEALAEGELAFIDNAADPLTGSIHLKAAFANADQKLWPGLFVDVIVELGKRPDSVVIPSAALQAGQNGLYVYVITADKKAEFREVKVAFEEAGEAVIASGLKGGETVVVEGQLRLAPGVKVNPKPLKGEAAPPPVPKVATEVAK